ncbi:MAG: hypothetical protein SynsKO_39050 [Synoicihabitans sp.]
MAGGGKVPGGARTGAKKVIPFAHQLSGYVSKNRDSVAALHPMRKEKTQLNGKFRGETRHIGAIENHRPKYNTHKA